MLTIHRTQYTDTTYIPHKPKQRETPHTYYAYDPVHKCLIHSLHTEKNTTHINNTHMLHIYANSIHILYIQHSMQISHTETLCRQIIYTYYT